MSEISYLRELYQEVIIDHNKNPRHFHILDNPTHYAQGFNPLCGDRLNLYLIIENNKIKNISFEGKGCAISTASASLMTEVLTGKTVAEAEILFQAFHNLLTENPEKPEKAANNKNILGKLLALKGVREFPARVKCATLAWHALNAALFSPDKTVSNE